MELKKMLIGLEGLKVKGDLSIDIKGLEKNSKEIKEGYLFIAIKALQQMVMHIFQMRLKMEQQQL